MSHDPGDNALEAELHSLRPRALPDRLVRDIEAPLADEAAATRRPAVWLRVAAAAVGLAACVAVAAFFWRERGATPADDPGVAVTPPAVELREAPGERPGGVTLAEYRAAFARSPEAMDALLERDAPRPPKATRRTASFRAFHGSALEMTAPADP